MNGAPLEPLPPIPVGTGPIFQWAKRIHKCIEARTLLGISGGSADRKLRGFWLRVNDQFTPSSGGVTPQAFRVHAVHPDYLTCNKVSYAGTTPSFEAEDVNVAKPYKLRKTPFIGVNVGSVTYSYDTGSYPEGNVRIAVFQGNSETQIVIPRYTKGGAGIFGSYQGDVIYAIENPLGGTGVLTEAGEAVTWMDTNQDSRAWAEGVP